MNKEKSFIELKQVSKSFNGNGKNFLALKDVSVKIEKGDFVIINGKSGGGKSTLLNMISGIDNPSSGEIWVGGIPIHNLNSNELARWRGVNLGIVFQFFQLMPTLNVLENVVLPMEFAGVIPIAKQKKRGEELLEKVEIGHLAGKLPNTLSGGEKQRVAIARALANNPSIIAADEPTGNLDSFNSQIIHRLFNNLAAEGKTILYVTHEKEIKVMNNKLYRMLDGQIVEKIAYGVPEGKNEKN